VNDGIRMRATPWKRRARIAAWFVLPIFALYLLAGFLLIPWAAREQMIMVARHEAGLRLSIDRIAFNPLTFHAVVNGFDLREDGGTPLVAFERLELDFALRSALDRVWTLASIAITRPAIFIEIRPGGASNFTQLIAALSSGDTQDQPPPRVRIRAVTLSDGRLEAVDPQAGPQARIALAPIRFQIEGFSTLESEQARYSLSARTAEGEAAQWSGEGALVPLRASGRLVLSDWHAATVTRMLGRWIRVEAPTGRITLAGKYDLSIDRGLPVGRISDIDIALDDLKAVTAISRVPLMSLARMRVSGAAVDLAAARVTVAGLHIDRLQVDLHDNDGPDGWRAAIVGAAPGPISADDAPGASADPARAAPRRWQVDLPRVEIAESTVAVSARRDRQVSEARIGRLNLSFGAQCSFGAGGAEIALHDPALSMSEVRLGRGDDRLRLGGLHLSLATATANSAGAAAASGIDLRIAGAQGKLAGSVVALEHAAAALQSARLAAAAPQVAARLDAVDLRVTFERPGWQRAGEQVRAERVALRAAGVVIGERLSRADRRIALTAVLREVGVSASGLGTMLSGAAGKLETLQAAAAALTIEPASDARAGADRLALGADGLRLTLGPLEFHGGSDELRLSGSVLTGANVRATFAADAKSDTATDPARISMVDLDMALSGLAARRSGAAAASVAFTKASLGARSVSLRAPVAGSAPLDTDNAVDGVRFALDGLDAVYRSDAVRLASLAFEWAQARTASGRSATAPGAVEFTGLRLDGAGGQVRRGTAIKDDTLRFGTATARVAKAAVTLDGAIRDLQAEGAEAGIRGLVVRNPTSGAELARLGQADIDGAAVRLRERILSVERLTFDDATGQATIDTGGNLDWNAFVAAFVPAPADAGVAPAQPVKPWQVAVKTITATRLSLGFVDHRRSPALTLALDGVSARAANLQTHGAAPGEIELTATVRSGGRITLKGRLDPGTFASELEVEVTELALAAAQPFLDPYLNLEIVSAAASAKGRLRYGMASVAGADLVYEGSLDVAKVLFEEPEPRAPLLSADTLFAPEVRLTVGPGGLDIPEVRVTGLATRLLIAEDQTVNLGRLLKPRPDSAGGGSNQDSFPVTIGRIRFEQGRLEFADRSLRPQFGVRVHEIGGTLTGVSSTSSVPSRLQLEGRVNEFGFVRIRGDLKLLAPQEFAKLGLTFRNLEMTTLTPYAAKFAGYRIASGKLSLDLDYELIDKRLVGQNRIVLDKLELGEKVDSPSARDLPIELAIALLQDDRGRIDIGLPVEGSLEDPQFDIGALIGRAIGNLIGAIVTAPFKLLAAIFGGSGDQLDHIAFDAGSARLLPPEQEKLRTVAAALAKRPQLALRVKPGVAAAEDAPAMQLIALRRSVMTQAGIAPDADEDPGPINFADPRMQRAIDALYAQRLGLPALRNRRAAFEQLAAAQSKATDRTYMMYRNLFEHLLPRDAVPDQAIEDLGRRRGAAILNELTQASGVEPRRVSTAPPAPVAPGSAGSVDNALEVAVAH